MDEADFGLWGTSDPDRAAVSANCDKPSHIVGYVCMTARGDWIIEGDPTNQVFATPREAAQVGLDHWFRVPSDSV